MSAIDLSPGFNLHKLYVDDYKVLTQFSIVLVVSLEQHMVDIILGSTWLDTLGTFMFNTREKFLTFPYKKKKVTFQDVTMKSSSGFVSTKDFKDISKALSQEDQKSIQKMHNEFDEVIIYKEEGISRLIDHNQKFLLQIKKAKDKTLYNQKLEEENQDLQKKLL